jgi:Peptidase family M50
MRWMPGKLLPTLAYFAVFYGGLWILGIGPPRNLSFWAIVGMCVWLVIGFFIGMVVHEAGHVAAVRLVGERVLSVRLGGKFASRTFNVGTVPVSVGPGLGGYITYDSQRLSAARRAAVLAAGPAASILVAPACLLLPVPHWEAAFLAIAVFAGALEDLAPGHLPDGTSTDGFKLLRTPARLRAAADVRGLLADPGWQDRPNAGDILINGWRLDVPEAEECLRELAKDLPGLISVYSKAWTLPDRPELEVVHIVHVLSWKVLATGDLPGETADLAASRVEWVLDHLDRENPSQSLPPHSIKSTLALARLRQRRPDDVQRLCVDALAADLDKDDRASALAMVAMARHACLLSGRPQLDEALELDPDADLVGEAVRLLDGGWDTALAAHDQRRGTPAAGAVALSASAPAAEVRPA